jgi:hypothetical protein
VYLYSRTAALEVGRAVLESLGWNGRSSSELGTGLGPSRELGTGTRLRKSEILAELVTEITYQ